MLIYALIFIIASLVLIKSSAVLVRALVNIARFMRWSEFLVSFILIGIATSLPELFVGISSAFNNASALSLGNIIGSNIVNLTLVAGIIILFSRGIKIKSKIIQRDVWIVFGLAVLPILFLLNKTLSRFEGLILLGLFAGYLIYLVRRKKESPKILNNFSEIKTVLKSIIIFIISLVLLLASAWLIVYSAQTIALGLNANLVLIGILIVAFGTSLPELIFGLRSVLMKHKEMHMGNLIGSTAANSALILGITALIRPIQLESLNSFITGAVFMILALLLFNLFIRTKNKLSWKEGLLLILFYVVFVLVSISLST